MFASNNRKVSRDRRSRLHRQIKSENSFRWLGFSCISKIKRPIMWLALAVTGLAAIILNIMEKNIDIPRMTPMEGNVYGNVRDIEYKKDKIYLYLKNIEFDDDLEQFEEIKTKGLLSKNSGIVCIFDDDVFLKGNEVSIGSNVCIYGKISVFDKASNPGEYDSRRYYISKGYLFKAFSCELKKTDSKKKPAADLAFEVSQKTGELLDKSLCEKDAGMMKAVLLADKSDLDSEVKNLYKDAGASHLLAISGLHITMFAAFILFILKRTPFNLKAAYSITIIILILYGYIIGFSPSASRAIVMFTILSIGKMIGKSYDSLTALAVASLITVIIKPLYVLQSGFIMSYLAIVGISVVLPAFETYGKRNPKILSSFFMSISVTMTTLPVVINSYYKIPLYAPLLNIILVPGMTVLLILGVLCIAFSFIVSSPLFIGFCNLLLSSGLMGFSFYTLLTSGKLNIFASFIHLFLLVYEWLMRAEMMLPKAIITTGARGLARCIIYEIILLVLFVLIKNIKLRAWREDKLLANRIRLDPTYNPSQKNRQNKKRNRLKLVLCSALLSLNFAAFFFYKRNDRIEFLDVGQGLCVCIQYNGKVYCYDGGSTSRNDIYEYVLSPYFAYYGIEKIDAWFISHEDADHTNGISAAFSNEDENHSNGISTSFSDEDKYYENGICNKYSQGGKLVIEEIIIPLALKDNFTEITDLAKKNNTKVIFAKEGDVFTAKETQNNPFSVISKGLKNSPDSVLFSKSANISFTVLSPDADAYSGDSNACSLVVLASLKEGNILFMGDADSIAEEKVINFMNEQINGAYSSSVNWKATDFKSSVNQKATNGISVLQSAHHGSCKNTNSEFFIQSINPRIAVISCGFNNSYGHPHNETLDILEKENVIIKRTDYDGGISIFP